MSSLNRRKNAKFYPTRIRNKAQQLYNEPTFIRLTQVNGHTGMTILIRISSIISLSPLTLDPREGSLVMLAGDQRPIKVSEPYGKIAVKLGIKVEDLLTMDEVKEEE